MQPRNAGQQVQVVVDDRFRNRGAGDEDDLGARHAQQEQEAQHALFVMVRAVDARQHVGVEIEARHDDHGARRVAVVVDLGVGTRELRLQLAESPQLLGSGRRVGIDAVGHGAAAGASHGRAVTADALHEVAEAIEAHGALAHGQHRRDRCPLQADLTVIVAEIAVARGRSVRRHDVESRTAPRSRAGRNASRAGVPKN